MYPAPAGSYQTATNTHNNTLPSFNIAWDVAPDVVLRGAAAEVIAWAPYNQEVHNTFLNDTVLTGSGGNANLDPYKSYNYDLSAEWYFAEQSVLAASVFYKDITQLHHDRLAHRAPVQHDLDDRSRYVPARLRDGGLGNCDAQGFCDYSILRPLNGGKATVKGFTLSYQQPFGDTGFGMYANYTYADGETKSGQDLPYNSQNAVNFCPYYEQGPFSARITYGWRSHYLAGGYVAGAPPASVDDYTELDASASVALQRQLLAELQRDEPARRDVPAVSRREGHDRRQVQDRPPLHGLVAFRVLTVALGTRSVHGSGRSVRARCFFEVRDAFAPSSRRRPGLQFPRATQGARIPAFAGMTMVAGRMIEDDAVRRLRSAQAIRSSAAALRRSLVAGCDDAEPPASMPARRVATARADPATRARRTEARHFPSARRRRAHRRFAERRSRRHRAPLRRSARRKRAASISTCVRSAAAIRRGAIVFSLDARAANVPSGEGYDLAVDAQRILLIAREPRGLFYGSVTLWQLLTADTAKVARLDVPQVHIADAPRFAWRGAMLDSARHFQSPEFVKRFIDQLALLKLNTLHWHLTDDQGWRIEIKRYPKLTEVGAWRRPAGAAGTDASGKPVRYGGFYTQDEIRDIVRYAAARYVTIVPEIDMPGHMQAAIAAYPELGSHRRHAGRLARLGRAHVSRQRRRRDARIPRQRARRSRRSFSGPVHPHRRRRSGQGSVEGVARACRRACARSASRTRMRCRAGSSREIEKHLAARGKRIVGWDEILEGGVPPNAIVMSWRGAKGGVEAAHAGHDVVMAPDPDLYFDHLQSDAPDEPPGRPTLRTLADIYAFEPVPPDMPADVASHVLGAQAELWTEHMRTEERVEHAAFPRLDALAEVLWSPKAARDWSGFVGRLAPEIVRQRILGVHVVDIADSARTPDDMLKSALTRTSRELKPCSGKLRLRLEDDAPADGPRAVFDTDLFDPCWIFENAPLDGIGGIAVDVGQIPYNFQLAHDITGIVPRPAPASRARRTPRQARRLQRAPRSRRLRSTAPSRIPRSRR